jgi:ACT domain-containing protein
MRKPASFYFFKTKVIPPENRYERWRGVADLLGFTTQEGLRVEWMVFYYTTGKENATLTTQHFGISRKTFYKWFKRFRALNTMSIAWLIGLELPIIRGIGK